MHTTLKSIGSILLIALLVSSDGCMTNTTIEHARGTTSGGYENENGEFIHYDKPNPAYYGLLPLTVPADIVTSPFQLGFYLWFTYGNGLEGAH